MTLWLVATSFAKCSTFPALLSILTFSTHQISHFKKRWYVEDKFFCAATEFNRKFTKWPITQTQWLSTYKIIPLKRSDDKIPLCCLLQNINSFVLSETHLRINRHFFPHKFSIWLHGQNLRLTILSNFGPVVNCPVPVCVIVCGPGISIE